MGTGIYATRSVYSTRVLHAPSPACVCARVRARPPPPPPLFRTRICRVCTRPTRRVLLKFLRFRETSFARARPPSPLLLRIFNTKLNILRKWRKIDNDDFGVGEISSYF